MGCGHSGHMSTSPRVSPMKTSSNDALIREEPSQEMVHPCHLMFPDIQRILNGISEIYRPQVSYFVCCLSNTSIPLSKSSIKHFFDEELDLHLPTIGIARYEQGRIICLGNLSFLVNNKSDEGESLSFLENMIEFAAGNPILPINVLLLGMYPKEAESIKRIFRDFRFNFEILTDIKDKDLSKYAVIFSMSNCTYGEELYNYICNGGGLICSSSFLEDDPQGQFCINKSLSKCGIAFSSIQKKFKFRQKSVTRTCPDPSELEKLSFPYFVHQYYEFLDSDAEINILQFSELITYFRIYLVCFERSNNHLFKDILRTSFLYLEKTNYCQPEGLFYSEIHQLIAVLLSDLFTKLSPELFTPEFSNKCSEIFPGHFMIEKLQNASIKLNVHFSSIEWYSTGLWLPAGVISEVKIQPQNFSNISIQIGSHADSLLDSPPPFKRWPVINQLYNVDGTKNPIQIASPFGGLIYIVVNEIKKSRAQELRVHFTNVCHSIFFKEGEDNSEVYNSINFNESEIPLFGEIKTKFVYFTLPFEEIKKIGKIENFIKYFDGLVQELLMFIGYKPPNLFRIVFDVQSPTEGSTIMYPLVLNLDIMDELFLNEEPSSGLFATLMKIAIVCFPEGSLNPNVEAAFAALSVAHTFNKKWPGVSPDEFIYEHFMPLFAELWEIYQSKGPKLLSVSLLYFQQSQMEKKTSYEESIKIIVNKMSTVMKEDYSYIIDNALKISNLGSQEFPSYIIEEEEEDVAV